MTIETPRERVMRKYKRIVALKATISGENPGRDPRVLLLAHHLIHDLNKSFPPPRWRRGGHPAVKDWGMAPGMLTDIPNPADEILALVMVRTMIAYDKISLLMSYTITVNGKDVSPVDDFGQLWEKEILNLIPEI